MITPQQPATFNVSFEFFPPKSEKMEKTLWASIERLAPLNPKFVSVTYGAGGSTRERTHRTVQALKQRTHLAPAAHLTCVNASCVEVDAVVDAYAEAGVQHIVALRGDPPDGIGSRYDAHPDGYQNTADLVAAIRARHAMEISVSAYPERHPESPDWDTEIDVLKRKVDAGATRAITQFFFDNTDYYRYIDRVSDAGITIPIVPGIAPIHSFKSVARFAKGCGARIPAALAARFDGLDADPKTHELVAATVAAEQVEGLRRQGIRDFHFYTMNKSDLVFAICHLLGMRPSAPPVASAEKPAIAVV
ncbi:MAG: methylenetetrahydrofolate reductase [NAD(P)H] [Devosiaceae bacterium]|nr:methylenetetrahydrofolate reductase [NAD(P)H] [Devosiaceae bacterium MH13]